MKGLDQVVCILKIYGLILYQCTDLRRCPAD